MTDGIILLNGKIHTIDPAGAKAEALAIGNGKILQVRKNQDIWSLRGDGLESMWGT